MRPPDLPPTMYSAGESSLRGIARQVKMLAQSDSRSALILDKTLAAGLAYRSFSPVAVIFEFETLANGDTMLSISEEGWKTDAAGLKASHEYCEGWTHMAMCLKGYIEHGIDLRA